MVQAKPGKKTTTGKVPSELAAVDMLTIYTDSASVSPRRVDLQVVVQLPPQLGVYAGVGDGVGAGQARVQGGGAGGQQQQGEQEAGRQGAGVTKVRWS